jgi:enoyl-CoA hydratase/carnithine racemase
MTDAPKHFNLSVEGGIARVSLDRPERKNPLTFESYAELRDWFRDLVYRDDIHGGVPAEWRQFLLRRRCPRHHRPSDKDDMKELLAFTRMTGDLVKAIVNCGKPVIAAVDGVCVGAGAIIAMASDLRIATPEAKTAFLFTRVGLAGCDMGACAILPRIIGQGRAAELLYTGRSMSAEEGERWGFYNRLVDAKSWKTKRSLPSGSWPGRTSPHDDQDHARAGMEHGHRTGDRGRSAGAGDLHADAGFRRAYDAFVNKEKPVFEGN